MTIDHFFLGAYWGPRRESRNNCAARTVQFLQYLKHLHSAFDYWMVALDTPVPSATIDLTIPEVNGLLDPHYDDLGRLMNDMGFRQSIWTANPGPNTGSSFTINCGAFSDCSPSVNSCVLSLPIDDNVVNALLKTDTAVELMKELVNAMEPDWAIFNSHQLREYLDPFRSGRHVGIVTFLASSKFSTPSLPAPPSKRLDVPGGSIILLTADRFSVENQEHLSIAKNVTKSLRKQGIFKIMKS